MLSGSAALVEAAPSRPTKARGEKYGVLAFHRLRHIGGHYPAGRVDFLEITADPNISYTVLTDQSQKIGLSVDMPVGRSTVGRFELSELQGQCTLAWIICERLMRRAAHVRIPGRELQDPSDEFIHFIIDVASHQKKLGGLCSVELPAYGKTHAQKDWVEEFGVPGSSNVPWHHHRMTGCQLNIQVKKPDLNRKIWIANFSLAPMTLGCGVRTEAPGASYSCSLARGIWWTAGSL